MDENNLPKGLFGFNKKDVEAYFGWDNYRHIGAWGD